MLRRNASAMGRPPTLALRPFATPTTTSSSAHQLKGRGEHHTSSTSAVSTAAAAAAALPAQHRSLLAHVLAGAMTVPGGALRPWVRSSRSLFRSSQPLLYRNVVENTLADTPSGYIQDPRAHPPQMVSYDTSKLSSRSAAALEAMEAERELMEKEELAYQGYTTVGIQRAKAVILNPGATEAALQTAVASLERELDEGLRPALGREVEKPPSKERILIMKWQQRQAKLTDKNTPFVAKRTTPAEKFEVRIAEDGSEEFVLTEGQEGSSAGDDDFAWGDVEAETLDPALLAPERVTVTQTDVNHALYVLGLGLRRLKRYDEAERVNLEILRTDVRSVDAAESLLELYSGLGDGEKIQALFEFLDREFESASREGRLSHIETGEKLKEGGERRANPFAPHERSGSGTTTTQAAAMQDSSQAAELPAGETELPDGKLLLAEGTEPLVTPVEIATAVLADMIVEAATRHCAEYGEGSTARFFLQSLSPLGKALNRTYMTMLIEALFRCMDEQHYVARFELDSEALARDNNLIYGVVIGFLKMLLVTRIPTMVDEPVRFRFMVLSKLHSALRSSNRKGESYRFCEDMFALYRANSSVYQQRKLAMDRARRAGASSFHLDTDPNKGGGAEEDAAAEASNATPPPTPLPLDDMDDSYRNSLFQYLNDRAVDSTTVGRELCLSVMEEFPEAAAPWETLALILHREDPKRNLRDAILAARRGLQLEPFNLSLILTCANLYKADHRYALYELILDRYRLLCYMLENAASDADLRAVAEEILEAERNISAEAEDVKMEEQRFQQEKLQDQPKLLRAMEEWARTHSETRSPRTFTYQQPVTVPSQELGISSQRPAEMGEDFRDANDALGRRGGGGNG